MVLGAIGGGMIGGAGVNIVIRVIDKFSKNIGLAQMQLGGLAGGIKKHQKAILGAGAAMTGFGIAGVAVMGGMVKEAISFETAFIGVRKTVELSEEGFKDLENRFKELSKTIPVTFQELSSIGEIAGQLGVEGVDNLAKFTKTIADIAATTNLTSEEAATSFARIANVMGEPIENVDRMGSAIVDLGNNFATTEREILEMSMRIMGAGKTIGLNTQEIFGMSAALSALGIRSEMGGSAISRAMITIAKSVATGSEELDKYAEVSEMSIEEFSKAWKEKPVEAFSKVIIGLKAISESGGNTFGVLEDLDLKSIRITDTMLRLAGSEGGITKAVKKSIKAWKENIALTKEAEKRYESMESQLKILTNEFKILAADLGEELFPVLEDIIGVVGDLVDWFSNLSDGTKSFIVKAGLLVTAFALIAGPMLIIIGLVPSVIGAFAMIGGAISSLGGVALIASGSIGLIVIALGGLAGIALWEHSKSLADTAEAYDTFGDVTTDSPQRFRDLKDAMGWMERGTRITEPIVEGLEDFNTAMSEFNATSGTFLTNMTKIQEALEAKEDKRPPIEPLFGFQLDFPFIRYIPQPEYTFWERLWGEPFETSKKNLEDSQLSIDELIKKMEEGNIIVSGSFENISGIAKKNMSIITGVVHEAGSAIADNKPGSFPIVYALGLAEIAWIKMSSMAIVQIQLIIDKINTIPKEIVTTHIIRTIYETSGGGNLESKQFGGYISHTGPYLLHKGETVIPTHKGESNAGITVNITGNLYGVDADDMAEALQDKLDTLIST